MDLLGSLVGIAHFGLSLERDFGRRRDESNEHRIGGKRGHHTDQHSSVSYSESMDEATLDTQVMDFGWAWHASKGSRSF